jgi:hypothetical protein
MLDSPSLREKFSYLQPSVLDAETEFSIKAGLMALLFVFSYSGIGMADLVSEFIG